MSIDREVPALVRRVRTEKDGNLLSVCVDLLAELDVFSGIWIVKSVPDRRGIDQSGVDRHDMFTGGELPLDLRGLLQLRAGTVRS